MSENCTKLCSILIKDSFGILVQQVAEFLLTRGLSPLNSIVLYSGLPRPATQATQAALRTLIQHCFVTIISPIDEDDTGPIKYKIFPDRIIEQLRYPKYFAHTEISMGQVGREIMEEVVRAGCLPLSKLIYICGHRVKTSNIDINETSLFDQLVLFRSTIQNLIHRKYLTICNLNVDIDKPGEVEEHQNKVNQESLKIPLIDLHKICTKLMTEPIQLVEDINKTATTEEKAKAGDEKVQSFIDIEAFTDSDILWTICISQFHSEVRNTIVFEALETKFKTMMVDTRILKILIDLGFEKYPWEKDGAPVTAAEIKDKLEKMEGGSLTSKFLDEHMDIIEEDPKLLLTRLNSNQGGIFCFNMKAATDELIWSTIDRIIAERHGFLALRIFRLIKDKGYLEQDSINELGMIPAKDAKHLTYKLVEDHLIFIKEIRKSYAPSAPPGKVVHVFHIDINQVVRTLKESCYKAMVNLKLRIKSDEFKNKRLLSKEERINRILVNMASKNCTEEQIEEVRELITPPEQEVLMKIQFQTGKLTSGMMHVDETLFIIQLYMLYHRRPVVTNKRSKTK